MPSYNPAWEDLCVCQLIKPKRIHDESLFLETPYIEKEYPPECSLFLAVLARGLTDALYGNKGAMAWVLDDHTEEAGSFLFCCLVNSLSPLCIREILSKKLTTRRLRLDRI
jgi:hypothetical protein